MKKRKKNKYSRQKNLEKIRRENELKTYGKIVSLRPSITFKDKTKYSRKQKHKNNEQYSR